MFALFVLSKNPPIAGSGRINWAAKEDLGESPYLTLAVVGVCCCTRVVFDPITQISFFSSEPMLAVLDKL